MRFVVLAKLVCGIEPLVYHLLERHSFDLETKTGEHNSDRAHGVWICSVNTRRTHVSSCWILERIRLTQILCTPNNISLQQDMNKQLQF